MTPDIRYKGIKGDKRVNHRNVKSKSQIDHEIWDCHRLRDFEDATLLFGKVA